jgi:hypothetical protein
MRGLPIRGAQRSAAKTRIVRLTNLMEGRGSIVLRVKVVEAKRTHLSDLSVR